MGKACYICNHPNRLEIDRELTAGKSRASISRNFDVSENSLLNHAENHLSRQLAQAMQKKQALEATGLLNGIEDLLSRTKNILTIAEEKKRYGLALGAIREARGTYELLSKIAFSLHEARLVELQIERERSGEADSERQHESAEKVRVLTTAELEMLEKLLQKMEDQDSTMIIIPDKPKAEWLNAGRTADDYEPEEEESEPPEPPMRRTKFHHYEDEIFEPIKLEPYSKHPLGTGRW